jgi:hypothetical protein
MTPVCPASVRHQEPCITSPLLPHLPASLSLSHQEHLYDLEKEMALDKPILYVLVGS